MEMRRLEYFIAVMKEVSSIWLAALADSDRYMGGLKAIVGAPNDLQ
jgi:hypothetical protein